jgi:hypothetical protein
MKPFINKFKKELPLFFNVISGPLGAFFDPTKVRSSSKL